MRSFDRTCRNMYRAVPRWAVLGLLVLAVESGAPVDAGAPSGDRKGHYVD